MAQVRRLRLELLVVLASFLVACSQQQAPSQPASAADQSPSAAAPAVTEAAVAPEEVMAETDRPEMIYEGGAHSDHDSKHGGTFFMALDNKHHLEGVLEPPGVFRVYLYDAYTQPASRAELDQVQAQVIWGDHDGAPILVLNATSDGSVLEAAAPAPVRFPVTLTLLFRFPGAPATGKAELFTIPFSHYSHTQADAHPQPEGN